MEIDKAINGIELAYVAKVIDESASPVTYETPMSIRGVKSVGGTLNVITGQNYSDNMLAIDESIVKSITNALVFRDLTEEQLAYLQGNKIDSATGSVIVSADDIAPKFAFGYKLTYNDGTFKLIWLLYGSFSNITELSGTTKGDGITYTDISLTYTALPIGVSKDLFVKVRSDSSYYNSAIGDAWFKKVQSPGTLREDVNIDKNNVPVNSITINNDKVLLNATASVISVSATILPTNATNKACTWTSTDDTTVRVTGSGLNCVITRVKAGTATVKATTSDGNKVASVLVTCL